MELTLNLAWMLLSGGMLWVLLRHAPREGAKRRTQLVALGVIVLILLPVISVTDDLMVVQNPALTDTAPRKGHIWSAAQSMHPASIEWALPACEVLTCGARHVAVLAPLPGQPSKRAATSSIQNRPPPTA
jgi:hypothetical protein